MSHLTALAVGLALDLLLGDPPRLPHPVVAIGRLIAWLERLLRKLLPAGARGETAAGAILVIVVAAVSFCVPLLIVTVAERHGFWLRTALESIVCYQALATKCLRDAAMRVYRALADGDIAGARNAVAMIVGRDTVELDASAVTRATVETVAENASDGVVAPMLYFALGGAPLVLLYKAINTMDSMLGYKNETYLHFGRSAARLDDIANFIPARLTALLMVPAAALVGLDWRGAARIGRRDGRNHTSPNAGYPEAACAGALGIVLGGTSSYGGTQIVKPTLGEPTRPVEAADIPRTCRLLYACSLLCFAACSCALLAVAAAKGGWTWI